MFPVRLKESVSLKVRVGGNEVCPRPHPPSWPDVVLQVNFGKLLAERRSCSDSWELRILFLVYTLYPVCKMLYKAGVDIHTQLEVNCLLRSLIYFICATNL